MLSLQRTYGDVVTAFIAMATHKWVESVAISARFVKVRRVVSCMQQCVFWLLSQQLAAVIRGGKRG